MTTQTEAMKLALEALELHGQQYPHMVKGYCLDAITALREARAEQPAQQEPVAWMSDRAVGFKRSEFGATPTVPLYTTPQPPAQPLTDAQIFDLAEPFGAFEYGDAQGHKRLAFARDIEAAHGITKGNT